MDSGTIGALNIKFTANDENVQKVIDNVVKTVGGMQKKINKATSQTGSNKAVQNAAKQAQQSQKNMNTMVNSIKAGCQSAIAGIGKLGSAIANIGKFMVFSWLGRQIINLGKKIFMLGSDMAETENLFQVSFGNMADRATEFTETLQEAWGVNPTPIKEQTAYLNQMLKSMKLGDETAYTMSTSLEKLSYNMSSLYNISQQSAFEKLRSGVAGQIRPLTLGAL